IHLQAGNIGELLKVRITRRYCGLYLQGHLLDSGSAARGRNTNRRHRGRDTNDVASGQIDPLSSTRDAGHELHNVLLSRFESVTHADDRRREIIELILWQPNHRSELREPKRSIIGGDVRSD